MSAAEKLKALKDEGTPESMAIYHDVHPQIVTVVEAAERADRDEKWNVDLRMSLAALDEALT